MSPKRLTKIVNTSFLAYVRVSVCVCLTFLPEALGERFVVVTDLLLLLHVECDQQLVQCPTGGAFRYQGQQIPGRKR